MYTVFIQSRFCAQPHGAAKRCRRISGAGFVALLSISGKVQTFGLHACGMHAFGLQTCGLTAHVSLYTKMLNFTTLSAGEPLQGGFQKATVLASAVYAGENSVCHGSVYPQHLDKQCIVRHRANVEMYVVTNSTGDRAKV